MNFVFMVECYSDISIFILLLRRLTNNLIKCALQYEYYKIILITIRALKENIFLEIISEIRNNFFGFRPPDLRAAVRLSENSRWPL